MPIPSSSSISEDYNKGINRQYSSSTQRNPNSAEQPTMSLDRDLRKLRLDKYTPAAANEARTWIEGILGERLASGDLLAALKDGVALCKFVHAGYHAAHGKWLTTIKQTCQPSPPSARRQVQDFFHALRTDGEHLPFPARLQSSSAKLARARHVPYSRPI